MFKTLKRCYVAYRSIFIKLKYYASIYTIIFVFSIIVPSHQVNRNPRPFQARPKKRDKQQNNCKNPLLWKLSIAEASILHCC